MLETYFDHAWAVAILVVLSALPGTTGSCRRAITCDFDADNCGFQTGKHGTNLNTWMRMNYLYGIPQHSGSFMFPYRGSQDKSGDVTVDMSTPAICSDAPLCVTFDYIIPLYSRTLHVLTQCNGQDARRPTILSIHGKTWQTTNVTFQPCSNSDTKIVFRGSVSPPKGMAVDNVHISPCPASATSKAPTSTARGRPPPTTRSTSALKPRSGPTTTAAKGRASSTARTRPSTSSAPSLPKSTPAPAHATTNARRTATPGVSTRPKSTPKPTFPMSPDPPQAAADKSSKNGHTTYIVVGAVLGGVVVVAVVVLTAVVVWRRRSQMPRSGTTYQSKVTMEKLEEEKENEDRDTTIRGVENKCYSG